jgi:hypothetical protein
LITSKGKKLKGTHKEKEKWFQAPKFIYGDYLFNFYFLTFGFCVEGGG